MRKDHRFKQKAPTEPGFYYARLTGTKEIWPVQVGDKGRVWGIGDDDWRPLNHYEWFGPVRTVEEKRR